MWPQGIFPDVPHTAYHRRELGVASKSALDILRRSPAHYKAWVDGSLEEETSEALEFGSAFHCALLEPERFVREYAVKPKFDRRTKAGKLAAEQWDDQHPGVRAISDHALGQIADMVRAVRNHPLAGRMIADGLPELTATWTDKTTGVRCKLRTDYYVEKRRMLVDVKTAEDASAKAFRRAVANYGYHRQDAMYRAGFAACGQPIDHFVLVCVEKRAPYAVATYVLDEGAIMRGHASVMQDMQTLADCLERDEWPGYPEEISELDLPPWAA